MPSAISTAIDNAILRCREAAAVADAISAAPAQVEALRIELVRLNSETNHLRQTLAAEKSAWLEEWKRLREEGDLASGDRRRAEEELLAKVAEAKATLVGVQNAINATHLKLEKIASLFRKLERMRAHPSSGAPGMSALVAEMMELAR
jgi:hypothetical protein